VHSSEYNHLKVASLPGEPPWRCWLRVAAAAKHLGIGVGTLNKLRTYGGGPRYAKLGHTVVYDPADLDAWVTERKVHTTSEPVRAA
jgi:predicted DNA-binding transcriptional regulator AlpA